MISKQSIIDLIHLIMIMNWTIHWKIIVKQLFTDLTHLKMIMNRIINK